MKPNNYCSHCQICTLLNPNSIGYSEMDQTPNLYQNKKVTVYCNVTITVYTSSRRVEKVFLTHQIQKGLDSIPIPLFFYCNHMMSHFQIVEFSSLPFSTEGCCKMRIVSPNVCFLYYCNLHRIIRLYKCR